MFFVWFPYKNITCNFSHENNISYVICFNSICKVKISDVTLIFICKGSISYVKPIFEHQHFTCQILNWFISRVNLVFHTWIGSHFIGNKKVSWVEMFQFHVFRLWNDMWDFCKGSFICAECCNLLMCSDRMQERVERYTDVISVLEKSLVSKLLDHSACLQGADPPWIVRTINV